MKTDDLVRDWKRISLRSGGGVIIPLAALFDSSLGRLGSPGTVFADYAYFAKKSSDGVKITLLRAGEGDACLKFVIEQGGYGEVQIGHFVLDS